MDNTLVNRCTMAFVDAIEESSYPGHTWRTRRLGVAAVLMHLSAEIITAQQTRKLDAIDIAQMLIDGADNVA